MKTILDKMYKKLVRIFSNRSTTYVDYNNANGLIDGRIPAGHVCPYLGKCIGKDDWCPRPGHLTNKATSCSIARMHSAFLSYKENEL